MNLTCDICNGKLSIVSGGVAVCEICGMEHSRERLIEKLDNADGVILQRNNSSQIETWMRMGKMASEAGNHSEAYQYFTKIVEVDPTNWRAIYEKGKSAAWQSTLGNLRISELYQGVNHALSLIDNLELAKDEIVLIKNEFAMELFEINNTITDLMQNNFNDKMDLYLDIHLEKLFEVRERSIKNIEKIEEAMTLINGFDDELSKQNILRMNKRICFELVEICYSMRTFWTDVMETNYTFIGLSAKDKKIYIDKFTKIVKKIHKVDPNYGRDEYSAPDPFDPPCKRSYGAISVPDERNAKIKQYWSEIYSEQAKAEWRKKVKKYWEEHREEKELLEGKKARLLKEIDDLKKDRGRLPERSTLANLKLKLDKLEFEKSILGMFKNKERRQKQQEINKLKEEYSNVELKLNETVDDIRNKIKSLQNEVKKIEDKLENLR